MRCSQNSVKDRIPHDHIGRSHIDFGTQAFFPVFILAVTHLLEEFEVFFYKTISPGAFCSRMFQISSRVMDLFAGLVIHISESHAYQFAGKFV